MEYPRALVHQKILDAAESSPEASIEALAEEVSGATLDLVEEVLDQYGDPAAHPTAEVADGDGSTETTGKTNIDGGDNTQADSNGEIAGPGPATGDQPTESDTANINQNDGSGGTVESQDEEPNAEDIDLATLSERERKTLRAIARRPAASQAEIGDELGVSRATVSKRVTNISGLEWRDRRRFVEQVLPDGFPEDGSPAESASISDSERDSPIKAGKASNADGDEQTDSETVSELRDRVTTLENRLEETDSEVISAGLAAKVAHACLDAEYISREEELEILEHVLNHEN